MMKYFIFISCVLYLSEGVKLPAYFPKCKQNEVKLNECLTKSANTGWSKFVRGDTKYHITPLSPLKLPFMETNIQNILAANYSNGRIDGLEDIHFTDIKFNMEKKQIDILYTQPLFTISGDCYVNANLLGTRVTGNGFTNLTYHDCSFHIHIDFELKEKNNNEYIEITAHQMVFTAKKMEIPIIKIFGDNEDQEKLFRDFANQNWRLLNEIIKTPINELIGGLYISALGQFFKKVPYSEFFE